MPPARGVVSVYRFFLKKFCSWKLKNQEGCYLDKTGTLEGRSLYGGESKVTRSFKIPVTGMQRRCLCTRLSRAGLIIVIA